jgi:hypothetical protein
MEDTSKHQRSAEPLAEFRSEDLGFVIITTLPAVIPAILGMVK